MRPFALAAALVLSLAARSAHATCVLGMPSNPENDCDNDGCKVGEGDCADVNPNYPAAATNGNETIRGPGCPNNAASEICDGLDNNCSGATDEGDPGGGGACTTALMGVCSAGTNH